MIKAALNRISAKTKSIFILIGFITLSWNSLFAQFYNGSQINFGKNRVQFNERFWTYYRFDRFDTYFYLAGKELADYTSQYVYTHLEEIEGLLEYKLENKIQFVVFNKLSDLKQTNIGLINEEQYNVGGVTHIIGTKVILYFNGSHVDLEKQIRAGIANVILNEMMYGSNIASRVKNTTLLTLPEWFIEGLISYISEEWSTDIDKQVKDGVLSGRYKKFNRLTGEDAVIAGHSIWNYIADKYGKSVIPNIVYMSKISRNIESGFLYVLGVSYKTLVNEWLLHNSKKYREDEENTYMPESAEVLKKYKKETLYNNLKISNNRRHVAYVTNESGRYKVWVHDLVKNKSKKILMSGYKLNQKTDYSFPLLAWHPSGKILSLILEKKGELWLYLYTLETKDFVKSRIQHFEKILDYGYSFNGKNFVMSAVMKGQSDIFIFNIAARSYEQITKDIYDDLLPSFLEKNDKIVFSSNRPDDTLRMGKSSEEINLSPTFDLFVYDNKRKNPILQNITSTPLATEKDANEYSPGIISYLSDESGINNRYIAVFDSAISYIDTITHYQYFTNTYAVTNYSGSIIEQDMDFRSSRIAEILYADGKFKMYVNDMVLPDRMIREEPEPTHYILRINKEAKKIESDKLDTEDEKKPRKRKRLINVMVSDIGQDENADNEEKKEEKIDINNYQFGKQSYMIIGNDTLKKQDVAGEENIFEIPKRRNYDVEYSINNLVSQIDFTFLNTSYQQFTGGGSPIFLNPGFNAFLKVGIMDLMEDYRITGGVRFSTDFSNNEYLLSFENLRKRLDKQLIFHRFVLQNYNDNFTSKQRSHEFHYILKWPFNQVISLKGSFILRHDRTTYLSTDIKNLQEPDERKNWYGIKGEYIFDNTRNVGLNLYYGTRYKFFGEYYQLIDRTYTNLIVLGFDYRRYTKIHRTLIWANRFAASTSFGNNRLIYYMGGVDNWLFPAFNQETNIAEDQSYAYQTLATNLRGFNQNIRNGNSFFVINSELRFPVFRYFANKPLKSDFFNNFQLVGFGDIGTAWTGLSPYDEENSLFQQRINQPPITVTLERKTEPIVGGFGGGARSRLLGYFIRADFAWGWEDGIVNPMVFYLSLSLDF